ncbi:MAG: hypothetical protein IH623_18795 [Verrucomicrobia bacterium]|nr:hypothetical protein [Verrucomicrobiota bacterium]
MHALTISLQAFVAASVFFVWVVRYANIIQEFKQYGLPDWLSAGRILTLPPRMWLRSGCERFLIRSEGKTQPKETDEP